MTLGKKLDKVPREEGVSTSTVILETTEELIDAEDDVVRYGHQESVPWQEGHDEHVQRELALIRKERELIKREQQLLGREREMTRSVSMMNGITSAAGSVQNLKQLLPEFDATDNTFWRWKNQLELLRNSYQLDDNSTRILISSRLKGRLLTWFYSKAEYLSLSIEDLLLVMKLMFDLRLGKLSLRREFET